MSPRTETGRRLRRSVAAALFVGGLLSGAVAGPVAGHSIVISSEPADGAIVGEPPRVVRLVFTEPVSVALTSIDLVAGDGRRIVVSGVSRDASDPNVLLVSLPTLSRDTYRLAWKSVSEQDLHVTEGSIVFGLGVAPGGRGANASADARPIDRVVRGVQIVAFALFVGAAVVGLLVRRAASRHPGGPGRPDAARRVAGVAILASIGLVAAHAAAIVTTASASGPLERTLSVVATTALGYRLAAAIGFAALGLVVAMVLALGRASRVTMERGLVAIAVALTVLQASTGHLAAQGGLPPGVGLGIGTLHLLAAAIWTGGVVVLAIAVLPEVRRGPAARSLAVGTARRFGAVAAVAFAVIVVTGLVASGQLIGSIDALLLSDYGHLIWIKSALLIVAGALGLASATKLHRRVGGAAARLHVPAVPRRWSGVVRPGGRVIAVEAAVMVGVLIAAANLAATQPARGPLWDAAAVAPDHASGQADDLFLSVDVRPNRPGRNFVAVGVFDTRRPAPAPIGRVVVTFEPVDGGASVVLPAAPVELGRFEAVVDGLDRPADWLVRVEVDREGLPQAGLVVPWTVPPAGVPAPGERPVLVSVLPLEPIATVAAAIATLVAVGIAIAVSRRPAASRSRPEVLPMAPSRVAGR